MLSPTSPTIVTSLSQVLLFVIQRTVNWPVISQTRILGGLPFPSLGDLSDPGIKYASPAGRFCTTEPRGMIKIYLERFPPPPMIKFYLEQFLVFFVHHAWVSSKI